MPSRERLWALRQTAKEVYIGGIPAGFTLGLGGAQVVGICEVLTVDGAKCPAKEAEIYVGDIILTLNGVTIESAKDLDTVLAKEKKTEYTVEIQRDGEEMTKETTRQGHHERKTQTRRARERQRIGHRDGHVH